MFHFPASRTAPPEIVRALKAIDPTAELVYFGDGTWVLGTVQPDSRLRQVAEKLIESVTRWYTLVDVQKLRMAKAHLQGFRVVAFYNHEPDRRIVADFEERDWRFRHRWLEELQAREDESEGVPQLEARKAAARENFEAAAKESHGWAFRAARNFRQIGFPNRGLQAA